MSEELRPCPFCGKKPSDDTSVGGCENDKCFISQEATSIKNWNSAWCWKEIDRLNKQIEELATHLRVKLAEDVLRKG